MKHELTSHAQINKRGKNGKSNSYLLWFIDGTQILKQKIPYDDSWDHGGQHRTKIYDCYVLNGRLHQTRKQYKGCKLDKKTNEYVLKYSKERHVSFPISKQKLNKLGILPDVKIIKV